MKLRQGSSISEDLPQLCEHLLFVRLGKKVASCTKGGRSEERSPCYSRYLRVRRPLELTLLVNHLYVQTVFLKNPRAAPMVVLAQREEIFI